MVGGPSSRDLLQYIKYIMYSRMSIQWKAHRWSCCSVGTLSAVAGLVFMLHRTYTGTSLADAEVPVLFARARVCDNSVDKVQEYDVHEGSTAVSNCPFVKVKCCCYCSADNVVLGSNTALVLLTNLNCPRLSQPKHPLNLRSGNFAYVTHIAWINKTYCTGSHKLNNHILVHVISSSSRNCPSSRARRRVGTLKRCL